MLLDQRAQQFVQSLILREPGVGCRLKCVGAECAAGATTTGIGVERGRPATVAEVTADRLVGVDPFDVPDESVVECELFVVQLER